MWNNDVLQQAMAASGPLRQGPHEINIRGKQVALLMVAKELMIELKLPVGDAISQALKLTEGIETHYKDEVVEAKAKDKEWRKKERERQEKLRKLRADTMNTMPSLGGISEYCSPADVGVEEDDDA